MKSASFDYHAPETVDELLATLSTLGDQAKVLAGGQSLVPILAMRLARFDHLVDLNFVDELSYIRKDGTGISIGAMARQALAERSTEIQNTVPLLHRAIPNIGHFQIRNRGTIGGSIAHGDPASELPAVAVALGAEIVVRSSDRTRVVPASQFFISTWETDVAEDECVIEVRFPLWGERSGFGFEEFAQRRGDFALAGAACAIALDPSEKIGKAGIALMGMGATPIHAQDAEQVLIGRTPSEVDVSEVARIAVAITDPADDIHAPGELRQQICIQQLSRALATALSEVSIV